jgi:two-component system, NtrC family, sensor kinase
MNVSEAPLPLHKSLRARGLLATLALLAYLFGAGLYIAGERGTLDLNIQSLEKLARHEKALALTEAALAGALAEVGANSNADAPAVAVPAELRVYMENCTRLFAALDEFDPGYERLQRSIVRSYDALVVMPLHANWLDMKTALRRAADDLEIRHRQLEEDRELLTVRYRRQYDAITVESLLLAALALGVFGSLAAWFFTRLSGDIRRLEEHARHIVRGSRGGALKVHREDELGRLMHAVNRMSDELNQREQQIELEAQRRSHHDKMLSVGALAAGVAHEVNNPLAVISSVAQQLQDASAGEPGGLLATSAALILAQAQRAGHAARHLAEVAAPQPAALDWVDVNALVRQSAQLIGYDRRYRRTACELRLDADLPAVRSSAGALQQVLMMALALAHEAVVAQGGTLPMMELLTHAEGDGIAVQLRFSGRLDFARGEVQRGLLLCRAIIEPLRGRLAFDQDQPPLQRIKLNLPSNPGGEEG